MGTGSEIERHSPDIVKPLRSPTPAERLEILKTELTPETVDSHRWIKDAVEARLSLRQDRAYRSDIRRMLTRDDVGQEIGHQLLLFEIDNLAHHQNTKGCQFLTRTRALLVEVASGEAPPDITKSVRERLQQLPETELRQVLIPEKKSLQAKGDVSHFSHLAKVASATISLVPETSHLYQEVIDRTAHVLIQSLSTDIDAGITMLRSASLEARAAWDSLLLRAQDTHFVSSAKVAALQLVDCSGSIDNRISDYSMLSEHLKEIANSTRREQAAQSAHELVKQLKELNPRTILPSTAFDIHNLNEALSVNRGTKLLSILLPSPDQLALAADHLAQSYQDTIRNPALGEQERHTLDDAWAGFEVMLAQQIESWTTERATNVAQTFLSLAEPCDDETLVVRLEEVGALRDCCQKSTISTLSDLPVSSSLITSACLNAHSSALERLNVVLQPVTDTITPRIEDLKSRKLAEVRNWVHNIFKEITVTEDPASVALTVFNAQKPLEIGPNFPQLIEETPIVDSPHGSTCLEKLPREIWHRTSEERPSRGLSRIINFSDEFFDLCDEFSASVNTKVQSSLIAAIPQIVERDIALRLGETTHTLKKLKARKELCSSTLHKIRECQQESSLEAQEQVTPRLLAELHRAYKAEYKNTTQLLQEYRATVLAQRSQNNYHNYHLKLVLSRMNFLCTLYGHETGIPFTDWVNRASKTSSFAIGSVTAKSETQFSGEGPALDQHVMASMGLSLKLIQSLSQTQRLEIVQALCPVRYDLPTVELEMGPTLENTLKRSQFVDWVMPHELAHIVDWKCGEPARAFVNKATSEIEEVVQLLPAETRETGRILIASQLAECVIDGIGFQMAREIGVSDFQLANPMTKPEQRVPHIIKSFVATCDTVCELTNSIEVDIPKAPIVQILLLRLNGVGKSLDQMSQTREEGLLSWSERLHAQIDTFGAEASWLPRDVRNKISALFQKGFSEGVAFPVPRRTKSSSSFRIDTNASVNEGAAGRNQLRQDDSNQSV